MCLIFNILLSFTFYLIRGIFCHLGNVQSVSQKKDIYA